jgi:hypothetical protein
VHQVLGPLWAAALSARTVLWHRIVKDERGEGVISAAIAVLIMAFLGALMWVGFRTIWGDAEANTRDQINTIGS